MQYEYYDANIHQWIFSNERLKGLLILLKFGLMVITCFVRWKHGKGHNCYANCTVLNFFFEKIHHFSYYVCVYESKREREVGGGRGGQGSERAVWTVIMCFLKMYVRAT